MRRAAGTYPAVVLQVKLIHCADLHLDSKMETWLPKEKAAERRREILRTFARMVEEADRQGVEAILLCGDLFDAGTVSARAANCVLDAVNNHPGIIFYYLQGNHDRNSFLADLPEEPENLRTFGEKWTIYRQGEVSIAGAELPKKGADRLCAELCLKENETNLVMLHGMAVEYGTSARPDTFSLSMLRGKYIDYLALGHIPSFQEGRLDDRGVWCYSGCLEGRGFDECGEKGYVLLEIEGGRVQSSFVPFAHRNFHELQADITGLTTQEQIRRKVQEALALVPQKDLAKVVLRGETAPEAEKDPAWLEKWLEDSCYFLKVRDQTRLAVRPEDYQYDVSLKGEFVRLVLASGMSREEKDQVLRLGIRALTGEE